MFGMYEFENSRLKRFFQSILCQMYHILVIEIMSKIILCKELESSDHVTDQITCWFMDWEEKQSNTPR